MVKWVQYKRLSISSFHYQRCLLTTLSVVFIGGVLGFASNYHQEHLYTKAAMKRKGRAPPEARLYWAAYGGLLFPLATFGFAWTGRPSVPWPVPAVFLCFVNWGIYSMYLGILYVWSQAQRLGSRSLTGLQ